MASGTVRMLREADDLTDPITGLSKPAALEMHLWLAQVRAARSGEVVAVIAADIEGYSSLVGKRGWAAGDDVLNQVAHRFQSCLRADDMVVRAFGDVFVGVCEHIENPCDLDVIVARLTKAFRAPFDVDGQRVPVTVNVGSVIAGPDERPNRAIRRAEDSIPTAR